MFDFTVTPDDGEVFQLTAGSRDIVRWEATGKGRTLGTLDANLRMTDLVDLAAVAAIRQGRWEGDIRSFRDACEITFDKPDDDDESDPDVDEMGPIERDR